MGFLTTSAAIVVANIKDTPLAGGGGVNKVLAHPIPGWNKEKVPGLGVGKNVAAIFGIEEKL